MVPGGEANQAVSKGFCFILFSVIFQPLVYYESLSDFFHVWIMQHNRKFFSRKHQSILYDEAVMLSLRKRGQCLGSNRIHVLEYECCMTG